MIVSGITSRTIQQVSGGMYTINDNYNNSIELIVPDGADISRLVAAFETSGDEVEVNGVVQTSGVMTRAGLLTAAHQIVSPDGGESDI
jgi:hypothetical protein